MRKSGEPRVKNRMMKKLRAQRGESLSETLVALLVAALAFVMLAGAVASGASAITKSRVKLNAYYDANETLSGVVQMASGGTSGKKVTLTAGDSSLTAQEVPIVYYENDGLGATPVIAYKAAPAGGTP